MAARSVFVAVLVMASAASASIAPLPFDAQHNTWNATHIVVVENGKVIESWKGDLKKGDDLHERAARFARIAPPPFEKPFLFPADQKLDDEPRVVSGKRMVLFLAFVPREGDESKGRVWMGADSPGHPADRVSPAAVAWIEDDQMYSVVGVLNSGSYAMRRNGSLAGLKQRVDLGIALQTQFEKAKADGDREARAERFFILTPIVAKYVGLSGRSDCFEELVRCGKPAAPYLYRWATDQKGEFWSDGVYGLCRLGDDAFDMMLKILDVETGHWKYIAEQLKPGDTVFTTPLRNAQFWRGCHHLYHVLNATSGMKISEVNKDRLRKHSGLIELQKLLVSKPGMTPEKSDMAGAHEILRDILAGKFRNAE